MFMFRPICWLKTAWRSLCRIGFADDGIYVDGCDFVEQDDGSLKCEACGKTSGAGNG